MLRSVTWTCSTTSRATHFHAQVVTTPRDWRTPLSLEKGFRCGGTTTDTPTMPAGITVYVIIVIARGANNIQGCQWSSSLLRCRRRRPCKRVQLLLSFVFMLHVALTQAQQQLHATIKFLGGLRRRGPKARLSTKDWNGAPTVSIKKKEAMKTQTFDPDELFYALFGVYADILRPFDM